MPTHLNKKSISVFPLRRYLGGSEMKQRGIGNSLDEQILFFLFFLVPVVPTLEPCCFMFSNDSLALDIKSLSHIV